MSSKVESYYDWSLGFRSISSDNSPKLKNTTKSNRSSRRTTTSLPGTPPSANSGERSMEKMRIISAKSVLIKETKNTRNAKETKVMRPLDPRKGKAMTAITKTIAISR